MRYYPTPPSVLIIIVLLITIILIRATQCWSEFRTRWLFSFSAFSRRSFKAARRQNPGQRFFSSIGPFTWFLSAQPHSPEFDLKSMSHIHQVGRRSSHKSRYTRPCLSPVEYTMHREREELPDEKNFDQFVSDCCPLSVLTTESFCHPIKRRGKWPKPFSFVW